jgi:hypothetical protein
MHALSTAAKVLLILSGFLYLVGIPAWGFALCVACGVAILGVVVLITRRERAAERRFVRTIARYGKADEVRTLLS